MKENIRIALIAPGSDGSRAMELANVAYLSAWTGQTVTLPLDALRCEEELQKRKDMERNAGKTV